MAAAKVTLADLVGRIDRIEEMVAGRFGPISDPAPDDWGRPIWQFPRWRIPVPVPNPGDPSPIDLGRLSRIQLKLVAHQIAAERIRLDSIESLVNEQLESLGKG